MVDLDCLIITSILKLLANSKYIILDIRKMYTLLSKWLPISYCINLTLVFLFYREKPKIIADSLPLLVKRGLHFTLNGNMKNNNLLRTAFFASRTIHNLTKLKLTNGNYARYYINIYIIY